MNLTFVHSTIAELLNKNVVNNNFSVKCPNYKRILKKILRIYDRACSRLSVQTQSASTIILDNPLSSLIALLMFFKKMKFLDVC